MGRPLLVGCPVHQVDPRDVPITFCERRFDVAARVLVPRVERARIALWVNGTRYDIEVSPRRTPTDALREECGLNGTHLGCEHGVCGACTVVVDGDAVRSCLMFAVHYGRRLYPRLPDARPLENDPGIAEDPEWLRALLTFSLCRCTGYETIRRAVIRAARGG